MDYEKHAATYAASNETNLFNAYYERPAMLNLVGDITGKRVLDAGCGHGPMMKLLRDRGAEVAGLDVSPSMLALAAENLGTDADLHHANLGQPLPFDDNTFDVIISSLALHYLKDWHLALTELRRILTPDGKIYISVNHPLTYGLNPGENYFEHVENRFEAELGDEMVEFTNWHRPLSAMSQAFIDAGFVITGIDEPAVADDTPPELLPEKIRETRKFLCMLFFTLEPK